MKDIDFYRLVRKEDRAYDFLEKKIWRREWRKCPFCKSTRPYFLSNGRFRCRACRKDFRSWTGRWLGHLRIKASQWLWIVKCFESEWTPLHAVQKVDLSYPTLLRAYQIIRQAILSPELRVSAKNPKIHAHGARKTTTDGFPPVSINELQGRMTIAHAPAFHPEKLKSNDVWGCRKGNFIALEQCAGHDWLIVYDDQSKAEFRPQASGVKKGDYFRKFAIKRLNKYHGVTTKYLAHYLNEVVFRYNHRNGDLFELVAQAVCETVEDV